jgi:hypothetical protein
MVQELDVDYATCRLKLLTCFIWAKHRQSRRTKRVHPCIVVSVAYSWPWPDASWSDVAYLRSRYVEPTLIAMKQWLAARLLIISAGVKIIDSTRETISLAHNLFFQFLVDLSLSRKWWRYRGKKADDHTRCPKRLNLHQALRPSQRSQRGYTKLAVV